MSMTLDLHFRSGLGQNVTFLLWGNQLHYRYWHNVISTRMNNPLFLWLWGYCAAILLELNLHCFPLIWCGTLCSIHYSDVIMSSMASQLTSPTIVCSNVSSGTNQRKRQSSATPVTDELSTQRASNAENVSIWLRHHEFIAYVMIYAMICFSLE